MIEVSLEPLPLPEQEKLQRWLNAPEFDILMRLAESREKALQVKALNSALKAEQGYPLKQEAVNLSMQEAARYSIFLGVLKSYQQGKEPFTVAKLT